MKIAMIGVGYVGLVTGVGFSQFGNEVICADVNAEKIKQLQAMKSPIYEPGLDELLRDNVTHGRLSFTTNIREAIAKSEVIFIAVGTPQAADGSADLSAVMATARTIGEVLRDTKQQQKVIVIKSTVPVGTNRQVGKIISSYFDRDGCMASNPEFLREGTAVEDFLRPDRVVVGTNCILARDALERLYRPFASGKILFMDPASSELVKYASNAYLAIRISYMNELSNLASAVGADIDHIRAGMGSDPRIGPRYLYTGPGYGGSCLPKDVSALEHIAEVAGQQMKLVRVAQEVNQARRQLLGNLVRKYFGSLSGKKICVWGAAFKAETDDIRESPALYFIDAMLSDGAIVTVHDPQASTRVAEHYGFRVSVVEDQYEALKDSDALALCTEWRQYRNPDIRLMKSVAPSLVVFDGRNIWEKKEFDAAGVHLFGIVRKPPALDSALHAGSSEFHTASDGVSIDPRIRIAQLSGSSHSWNEK